MGLGLILRGRQRLGGFVTTTAEPQGAFKGLPGAFTQTGPASATRASGAILGAVHVTSARLA